MLHQFDLMIVAAMEQQHRVGPWTRENRERLSRLQLAACQIVPGALSIALGIRELIRQAYLFPGFMLLRPLVERAATISYLAETPAALDLWEEGWPYSKRPRLPDLLSSMRTGQPPSGVADLEARKVANHYNALVHGDPVAAQANIVLGATGEPTHTVSKDLDSPDKADDLASHGAMYLIVLIARTAQIFPAAASN